MGIKNGFAEILELRKKGLIFELHRREWGYIKHRNVYQKALQFPQLLEYKKKLVYRFKR